MLCDGNDVLDVFIDAIDDGDDDDAWIVVTVSVCVMAKWFSSQKPGQQSDHVITKYHIQWSHRYYLPVCIEDDDCDIDADVGYVLNFLTFWLIFVW